MKKAARVAVLLFLLLAVGNLGWRNRELKQRLAVREDNQPAVGLSTPENTPDAVPRVAGRAFAAVVTINLKEIPRDRLSSPLGAFSALLPETERINTNVGSGFAAAENLVVTNRHVVGEENAVYAVVAADGKEYRISEIYRDGGHDLAILRIEPEAGEGFKALPLGESDTLRLGETVLAVGTPFGELTNTVTSGIVSGLGRGIEAGHPLGLSSEKIDNVIQTDAAISPGSSGGPLLNLKGEVVGVNTAMAVVGENLGFAIPVEAVKEMLVNYREQGG